LKNQGIILHWIRRLARDGMTVVFTTHQPQHADLVADDALLMFEGQRYIDGPAAQTLTENNLRELFGVELRRVAVDGDDGRSHAIVPIWPR
jgi:iron complex transport system ATP-binding protein